MLQPRARDFGMQVGRAHSDAEVQVRIRPDIEHAKIQTDPIRMPQLQADVKLQRSIVQNSIITPVKKDVELQVDALKPQGQNIFKTALKYLAVGAVGYVLGARNGGNHLQPEAMTTLNGLQSLNLDHQEQLNLPMCLNYAVDEKDQCSRISNLIKPECDLDDEQSKAKKVEKEGIKMW